MPSGLLHSQADILRQLLVDLGMGGDYTSDAWPVFASGEPSDPDNVITVFNTQGRDQGRHMIDGSRQTYPGVQIRIRSSGPDAGFAKAAEIADAIDEDVYDQTVTVASTPNAGTASYLVHALSRNSDVLDLGRDVPNSHRHVFTINATVTLKRIN